MIIRETRRTRAVIGVVIACVLALTSLSAHAATKKKKKKPAPPKPVCNLITDPKGDVSTGDQSLDVLSADVATNATMITGVIRVAKLANPDTMSPQGTFYSIRFTAGSSQTGQNLDIQLAPTGNTFEGGAGTGVVDLAKNEIRISVPLSHWTGNTALSPGPPLHDFIVYADLGNDVLATPTTFTAAGDTATSKATYAPGTPSCVAVGK